MMKPIQFRKGPQINMNLLKLEIDRRFDIVTMMIKGMGGGGQQNRSRKVQSTYCQTQTKNFPLQEISNLNVINSPPMTSIISPTNSKKSKLTVNNENEFAKRLSITSKSKKLNPIQECENQALRTSRCLLQSQKKKNKKLIFNQQSSKKNHKYRALGKKSIESNSVKDDESEVFNSFESTRKAILTEKKFFPSRNAKKFTTEEKAPVDFSVNSLIYELSKSNSNLSSRKSPANFNDNISLNSTSNINKKPNHSSFSTNNVTSSGFVSDYLIGDSFGNVQKRIIISKDIRNSVQEQFESKFDNLKKKAGKQPKTNNVRMALLKRLQIMLEKTVQVTK